MRIEYGELVHQILFFELDQLVTINSTVPLYCRQHLQRSSCCVTQGLRSGHRHTHDHRHVRILRTSRSFHVSNDGVTDGVRDAQCLYFITQVRCPQVDHCLFCQQRCVVDFYQ
ncbi:hypothetical protein PoB_001691700 [Plakobranchus ocellatus]|uniref:Uncharacterized protein n=1 Tax=Plakobranchus ocellatus TaxID=259542 RepID=A0AAV3Z7B5_9GAST|nr:hypothetical protein PoB_001691700 [Plakobranchus ocellatus]